MRPNQKTDTWAGRPPPRAQMDTWKLPEKMKDDAHGPRMEK